MPNIEEIHRIKDDQKRLSGIIAHELAGPMQILYGIAYGMKRKAKRKEDETDKTYIKRFEREANEESDRIIRAVNLMKDISRLLDLGGMSKKELLESPEEINLEEKLEDLAITYDGYLRKRRIKLETHYDTAEENPLKIHANPSVISSLLGILSGNAITYAPEESIIKEGLWASPRNLHYFLENEKGERKQDSPGMGRGRGFPYTKRVVETLKGDLKTHHTPKFHEHTYTRKITHGYKSGPSEFNGNAEIFSVEIMIPTDILTKQTTKS